MRESEDVATAADFLESRDINEIAVIGNSRGATSAIEAASNDPRIQVVVAQVIGTDLDDMIKASSVFGFFASLDADVVRDALFSTSGCRLAFDITGWCIAC